MRIFQTFGMVLLVASCSGGGTGSLGNLNPFNWFKGGASSQLNAPVTLAPRRGYATIVDTRPLVDQITNLSIDKTASGVIVRATGLPLGQGYHSADLVLVSSNKTNELTFEFRVRPPGQLVSVGPVHLRQIIAGIHLNQTQLRGVSRIRVVAARNSKTARS